MYLIRGVFVQKSICLSRHVYQAKRFSGHEIGTSFCGKKPGKRLRRILSVIAFISLIPFSLSSEIQFTDFTLSGSANLLFSANATFPGFGMYKTLFLSSIKDKKTSQLTFFPEEIHYSSGSGVLQIQNRYGVFRSDSDLKNFLPLPIFPAFVNGYEIEQGKISPVKTSPDGKYLIYYKPASSAYGTLMLYDVGNNREIIVSEKVPLSLGNPPVMWSSNSRNFIYSKSYKLYYFSIDHLEKNRVLAENYRNVADGFLSNVQWDSFGNLYYISGTLVFKIQNAELFTRALYSGTVPIGSIVGKIPFEFQPNVDRFWISPDGTKIVLNKSQQSVFFFYLIQRDYSANGAIKSLPHLYLPRSVALTKVLWSGADQITLFTEGMEKGAKVHFIFRLIVPADGMVQSFTQTQDRGVSDLVLSDGENKILLIKTDRVEIFDYITWKKESEIIFPSPLHALWRSKTEIIIAGANTIELCDTTKKTSTMLALSQPGESGFSADGTTIMTRRGDKVYSTGLTRTAWQTAAAYNVGEPASATADFRVYLETIERGNYKNMLMIRDLKGMATAPLFPYRTYAYEDYPKTEEAIDYTYFNHGSRIRRREVAIVFNAVYSTEGLSTILTILKDYGIKSTFFVNGEFIRRYPDAVKEIADSGHDTGSLFYAYFNMTDSQSAVDTDFIKKGLARNEDEYFQATGKELSLFWHAPYYFINSTIIDASRQMNYAYVGRDVDSLDWVGKTDITVSAGSYLSAPELVERIISLKKPGSIISIELGVSVNNRDDFLFQYLDILINALTRLGYDIVPVSALIEHSK
jgi:peptidoglycan/xylan/chitin deacetylase (PgdA/CDA1 family)/WD40 repeat protein